MKSILLSIKPEWVAKILNGEKTIEIRKKFPKDYVGWVYIYCTKDGKKPYDGLVPYENKKGYCLVNKSMFPYDEYEEQGYRLLNGKVVARFWCDKVDKLETEFYIEEPLYEEYGTYQAIKRVCLEQLEYVDFDEDLCDRETLYTNEIFEHEERTNRFLKATGLTGKQLQNYFNGCDVGYAIHISKLEVFDRPKELSDFYTFNTKTEDVCGKPVFRWTKPIIKAPQNYCYIEGETLL